MNTSKIIKQTLFILLISFISACKPAKVVNENIFLNELADGTYTGNYKHTNTAEVKLVIKNHTISELKLIKLDATPYGKKAKDSIPQRILEKQSPYVDAVSGATEASNVIINATVNALKKAINK